jgi:hypothetical protein
MDGKRNVVGHTCTDGQDEKHSLQKKICNYEQDPCQESASLLTKLADLQTLNTLGISSLRVTAMVTRSLK